MTTLGTTPTTPSPTTTSSPELSDPHTVAASFLLTFEATRDDIIDVLEDDANVESVDKYAAEAEDEGGLTSVRVVLGITSSWTSESDQVDGAWEITQSYAGLYTKAHGLYSDVWMPDFDFTNSGHSYRCTGEFMALLGSGDKSRADWESEC